MSAFESEEDPEQDERGDVLHTNLQNINSNPTFFPPQDIRRRTSLPIQFYNRCLPGLTLQELKKIIKKT